MAFLILKTGNLDAFYPDLFKLAKTINLDVLFHIIDQLSVISWFPRGVLTRSQAPTLVSGAFARVVITDVKHFN